MLLCAGRAAAKRLAAEQRAVVLDEAFKRLPGEVEAIEAGIFPL